MNMIYDHADATCRQCGEEIGAETLIETALKAHSSGHDYEAVKDGGERALERCPECSCESYVMYDDENGCAWCQLELGKCSLEASLTPNNVAWDNHGFCSYCDYKLGKDG